MENLVELKGQVPLRTSYSIDYYKKTADSSYSCNKNGVLKSFKANFKLGNDECHSDFLSTTKQYQTNCLLSKDYRNCLNGNRTKIHKPAISRIGNTNEHHLLTTNNQYYQAKQIDFDPKQTNKFTKLKALNLFEQNQNLTEKEFQNERKKEELKNLHKEQFCNKSSQIKPKDSQGN